MVEESLIGNNKDDKPPYFQLFQFVFKAMEKLYKTKEDQAKNTDLQMRTQQQEAEVL